VRPQSEQGKELSKVHQALGFLTFSRCQTVSTVLAIQQFLQTLLYSHWELELLQIRREFDLNTHMLRHSLS
jgi:hypothetical protein